MESVRSVSLEESDRNELSSGSLGPQYGGFGYDIWDQVY